MPRSLISLKPSCSNRHSSQVLPSFSERAFFMQDFSSPDFLDSCVFPHYDFESESLTDQQLSLLSSTISQATEVFDAVRAQIASLEAQFIRQLTSFIARPDKTEDLLMVKNAMRRCHSRLLKSKLEPRLVEEFAELLDTYDKVHKKKTIDLSLAEKMTSITQKLDQMREELNKTTDSCLRLASTFWPSILSREVIWPEPSLNGRMRKILRRRRMNEKMIDDDDNYDNNSDSDYYFHEDEDEGKNEEKIGYQGTFLIQDNRDYYLHLTKSDHTRKLELLDVELKRAVCSRIDPDNDNTDFFYADSLDSVIATAPGPQDTAALTIYRVSSRGLSKAARIEMRSIPLHIAKNSTLRFQMLDPQYMIAVISPYCVTLLNIFTRRVVKQYVYKEEILSADYMRHERLFVVIMENKLLVYDMSDQCRLSIVMTEHPFAYGWGLTVKSNIIMHWIYKEDYERNSHTYEGSITEDNSIYTFHLFKVTRQGIRECQTKLRVGDLLDDGDYYAEGSYTETTFDLRYYELRPESEEIKLFYSIRDDKGLCRIEYKFNDDKK